MSLNEEIGMKENVIGEVHGNRMHWAGLAWACSVNEECQDKEIVIGSGALTTEKHVRK